MGGENNSGIGLSMNSITGNNTTGYTIPEVTVTASKATSAGPSQWENILGQLPGILNGSAQVIAATKGNGVAVPTNSAFMPDNGNNGGGMWLWIIIGVVLLGLVFFMMKK